MGIFNDLDFKNRDGHIVVPDSEFFEGKTLEEIEDSIETLALKSDIDGLIQIQGTSLPVTVTQSLAQTNWLKYQVTATNLVGDIIINGSTQVLFSETIVGSSTIKIFESVYDFVDTLNISTTGSVGLVEIETWVRDES